MGQRQPRCVPSPLGALPGLSRCHMVLPWPGTGWEGTGAHQTLVPPAAGTAPAHGGSWGHTFSHLGSAAVRFGVCWGSCGATGSGHSTWPGLRCRYPLPHAKPSHRAGPRWRDRAGTARTSPQPRAAAVCWGLQAGVPAASVPGATLPCTSVPALTCRSPSHGTVRCWHVPGPAHTVTQPSCARARAGSSGAVPPPRHSGARPAWTLSPSQPDPAGVIFTAGGER